jgi:PIN domain nuclease of toxin-antitoxin system
MVRSADPARYLIDTHVLIWAMDGSARLSVEQREVLARGQHLFVSPAALWEIAAKSAKGKLKLGSDLDEALAVAGCIELPITWAHARRLRTLPDLHRDPFDRIMVAQALVEDLILLSSDADIRKYPVRTL